MYFLETHVQGGKHLKKNIKKRVFSIILAVSAVLFSLPFQRVQAGTENPEAIQARLCTVFGESISGSLPAWNLPFPRIWT